TSQDQQPTKGSSRRTSRYSVSSPAPTAKNTATVDFDGRATNYVVVNHRQRVMIVSSEDSSHTVGCGQHSPTLRRRRSDELAASPTLRRRRLARQLLRLREEAGMTAKQAAAEAKKRAPKGSWFEAKITRIETRKILRVRDADVQTLLDVYGVTDPDDRDAYRRLAREAAQSGWWVG